MTENYAWVQAQSVGTKVCRAIWGDPSVYYQQITTGVWHVYYNGPGSGRLHSFSAEEQAATDWGTSA